MVDYNTPLMLRPTVAAESLPNIYQQVETVRALQGANTDNDIKRDALNDYAARRSVGDPNAPDSLDTQPQLLAQVTAARNAMSQEQRTKFDFDMGHRARIAFAVSAYPAGSVERQKAWDSGLKELLQVGALPSEKYQEMVGKPPNDLVLQQYQMLGGLDFIKQARQDAAGARNMANFAAAEGGASPSTPGAPPPAAAAPAAAAPSPAAAAGFRPGPIPTPFGAPAAQPQPNAGLTPAAPVASPLRPAPASAPAPAPVAPAAAPAAPAYPAAAAAAAQGGAAVTPPAEAPAAPAGRTPEQAAEAERILSSSLAGFGNPQARAQLRAATQAMMDPATPEAQRKAAEKIYDRAAADMKLTDRQNEYLGEMRQRMALNDPNKPVLTFSEWNRTDLQQNYDRYVADETARGTDKGKIKSFEQWHLNTIREASNRPEATIDAELAKGLTKRINDAAEEAKEAFNNREIVGRLGTMLERSGTGATTAFANFVRENMGETVASMFKGKKELSAAEAADALVNYLKPRMRVAGTGASSDKDLLAFGKAIPSLMSSEEGKRMVVETLGGIYQRSMDVGEIAKRAQTGDIEAKAFDKEIAKLSDPFSSFKAWQNSEAGRAGKAPPDVPVFATIDEAKAAKAAGKLNQGDTYRLKDGRYGEVP